MMNNTLRHTPDGFSKIIAASLILHVAVIVFALVIYKGGAGRIYLTPVTVSLVGPEALGRQGISAASPAAAAPEAAAEKQVEGAKPPASPVMKPVVKPVAASVFKPAAAARPRVKSRATEKTNPPLRGLSPFALKKHENTVEDAIKVLREKVRKKEDKEELHAAESHIDALKKKNASSAKAAKHAGQGQSGNSKTSNALQAFTKTDGATSGQGGVKTGGAGTGVDSPSVKYRAYLTAVGDRVKNNWTYPEEFRKDKIEVIVSIKINRDGKLLDSWVEKSSGSNLFDESLMDAVKKSAPYPQLPEDYDGNVFETGLRFCKNCAQ